MATPKWNAGTFYPPGSLVQPLTALEPIVTSLDNPGFDDGTLGGWTFTGPGARAITTLNSHGGVYNLALDNGEVIGQNNENPAASEGLAITASIQVRLSSSGLSAARVRLWWLDAGGLTIGAPVDGNLVQKPASRSERWVQSTVNAVAPALTASVKIGFWSNSGIGDGDTRVDSLAWNYAGASAPAGLIFRAVQPLAGFSGVDEPTWPLVNGLTVVDNEVTWEAVLANRVIWQASPIMLSGSVEPDWPVVLGENVSDNTIVWETISGRVEDPKCPNSKIVIILASKVYAADGDIVAYSATTNPLDWSTRRDAGFLPTNLQTYGANPVAALGAYRSNLLVFNSQGFQMWQVDEDPELSNLLDALPVPCVEHWSYAPVSNDGLFYSPLGVRSVNISAGSTNLAAGDVGLPVDPILNESYAYAKSIGVKALGFYFPGAGQYWLSFSYDGVLDVDVEPENPTDPITEEYPFQCIAWIYNITQAGAVGSWSRYLFPFKIDSVTQDGTTLVFRSGDDILEYDREALVDFLDRDGESGGTIQFPGLIWYPYLDYGAPGIEKNLIGFDMVATNDCILSFGFAQDDDMDPLGFTTPYGVMADTIPGDVVPFEMTAPSFSVKITYNNGQPWKFLAMNLYLRNWRS